MNRVLALYSTIGIRLGPRVSSWLPMWVISTILGQFLLLHSAWLAHFFHESSLSGLLISMQDEEESLMIWKYEHFLRFAQSGFENRFFVS